MGLFRKVLAAPFYGYAGICAVVRWLSTSVGTSSSKRSNWRSCFWKERVRQNMLLTDKDRHRRTRFIVLKHVSVCVMTLEWVQCPIMKTEYKIEVEK